LNSAERIPRHVFLFSESGGQYYFFEKLLAGDATQSGDFCGPNNTLTNTYCITHMNAKFWWLPLPGICSSSVGGGYFWLLV
jgi:hypothetical protein